MAVHLAALERQQGLLRALVALDHLEPGAQQRVHQPRIVGRRRRRGGAADDELVGLQVRHGGDRRRQPHEHQPHLLLRGADPVEFRRHVARRLVLGIEQRLDAHAAPDHADLGAVMAGDVVEIVGRHHAGGAGHLLHDEERMPGQMAAQIGSEQAAVGFVAAAAGGADDELDLLAGEELLHRLGACRDGEEAERGATGRRAQRPRRDAEIGHGTSLPRPEGERVG